MTHTRHRVLLYVFAVLAAVIAAYPFVFMLQTAFKTSGEFSSPRCRSRSHQI